MAALELGKSRASDIGKKAELNRITAYEILKRLRQKGLITTATYNNVQTFQAIAPQLLIQKMEQRVTLAKDALPQLSLLCAQSKTRPKIQYFEGTEGLRTIYEDTLSSKEKMIYEPF